MNIQSPTPGLSGPLFGALSCSTDSLTALPLDIRRAIEVFQRPDVQVLVADLQKSVFDFLLQVPEPLCAIDCQTERGNFVRDGISELLTSSQERGEIPIVLERFGTVKIVAGGRELSVGSISLSWDSPMLREDFVNKSSSQHAAKAVFQLQQIDSWVPVEQVLHGDPSGFVLSDQQSLAAEIVMTMDYMVVYARIAQDIATHEQDSGESLLRMKVGANLQDCLGAARYFRNLEIRVRELTAKISDTSLWAALTGPEIRSQE